MSVIHLLTLNSLGELIDAYQCRTISHKERCRMAMSTYFFLHMWKNHIEQIQKNHPDIIDIKKNFLAPQTFKILISLTESLVSFSTIFI